MTDTTINTHPAVTPALPVRLPPSPPIPRFLQGLGFSLSRKWTIAQIARRYGDAFTMRIPVFGRTVIVTEPGLDRKSVV